MIHDKRKADSGSFGDYVRIEINSVEAEARLIDSGFERFDISNASCTA
jgi:hypothetical protein